MKFDPLKSRAERLAMLRRLSGEASDHKERAGEIRGQLRSDREVAGQKLEIRSQIGIVPDFRPVPNSLAIRMVTEANLAPGMSVCEPSAGGGAIADVIRAVPFPLHLQLIEWNERLAQLLIRKGYENVRCMDFLEYVGIHDRFIMNPPFSKLQDVDHVMYAYLLLARRGRIVAIMGESAFFNERKKAAEFRAWLEKVGGTSEKLPRDTFTESGSPVSARFVIIDKP